MVNTSELLELNYTCFVKYVKICKRSKCISARQRVLQSNFAFFYFVLRRIPVKDEISTTIYD